MNRRPVVYMQTDRRWKALPYRVRGETATIGGSGCGPTAAAMAIETLTGKPVLVVEDHPYPMERFEPTPKAVRPPRPERAQRAGTPKAAPSNKPRAAVAKPMPATPIQAAPPKKSPAGPRKTAAPKPVQAAPAKPEKRNVGAPPSDRGVKTVPFYDLPARSAPRPSRKLSSDPPALPGRVAAFADGRRRRGGRPQGR